MDTVPPTIGKLVGSSWEILKQHFWVLLGFLITYLIVSFMIGLIFGLFLGLSGMPPESSLSAVLQVTMNLISLVLSILFSIGFVKATLNAVDGVDSTFAVFKTTIDKFWYMLATSILVAVIVLVGFFFLIVPGIYLALRLQFAGFFVVDQDKSPIEAIKSSWELTKGEAGYLFLVTLTILGLTILGLICLIVGVFVTAILSYIMFAYLFRYYLSAKTGEAME